MSFMLLGILNSQAAGGDLSAYDLLETTTLSSSASQISFTGLDTYSDYQHLQIRMSISALSEWYLAPAIRFNNDTSTTTSGHWLTGNGSSLSSNDLLSQSYSYLAGAGDDIYPSAIVLDVLDYSSPNKNTTTRAFSGVAGDYIEIGLYSTLYPSTNAITSLQIILVGGTGNYLANSRFSLYGIRGA